MGRSAVGREASHSPTLGRVLKRDMRFASWRWKNFQRALLDQAKDAPGPTSWALLQLPGTRHSERAQAPRIAFLEEGAT